MKTFLDSGVLLTAWRGDRSDSQIALALLDETGREFYTSQLVRLELLPKASYFKQSREIAFYEKYFALVKAEESLSRELGEEASQIGRQFGLAAGDAIHMAAAIRQGVKEFITTEKTEKPMFRVAGISVRMLASLPL